MLCGEADQLPELVAEARPSRPRLHRRGSGGEADRCSTRTCTVTAPPSTTGAEVMLSCPGVAPRARRADHRRLGLPLRASDDRRARMISDIYVDDGDDPECWAAVTRPPSYAATKSTGKAAASSTSVTASGGRVAAFKVRFDLIAPEQLKPFPSPTTATRTREVSSTGWHGTGVLVDLSLDTLANKVKACAEDVTRARRCLPKLRRRSAILVRPLPGRDPALTAPAGPRGRLGHAGGEADATRSRRPGEGAGPARGASWRGCSARG